MENRERTATDWRVLYGELAKKLKFPLHEQEKRQHARLMLPDKIELFVQIASQAYRVIDISPGGICFLSNRPFTGGDEVAIVYGMTFKLLSYIVYCRADIVTPPSREGVYRVGAKFLEEDEGYKIMVMVLEFYSGSLDGDTG